MKTTYRALAYTVLTLVVVQAADLAYGFFGMGSWVEDGNDFTKSALDSNGTGMTGEAGLMLHSVIGQFLILWFSIKAIGAASLSIKQDTSTMGTSLAI